MRRNIVVSAVLTVLFVVPITFMLGDNTPPYEYDAANSYIVPSNTESGKQILVHWKLKRINRLCPGAVTRYVVDNATGARFSYDPTPAAKTIDVRDDYLDRTFFLPQNVSPGEKSYYAEGYYACNPLQRFFPLYVQTPRLLFTVQPH